MVGAKLTNVGVPLLLKSLVDSMSYKPGDPAAILVVPVALLFAYGALCLSNMPARPALGPVQKVCQCRPRELG